MKLIYGFIGSPGSGKSTQAEYLAELLVEQGQKVTYINIGQILRESEDKEVIKIMNTGELVDDEVIFRVLEKRFSLIKEESKVILDGFFRRDAEAKWLMQNSQRLNVQLECLVDLKLSKREATRRLSQRGRSDDGLEDIKVRLKVFARERRGVLRVLWKAKVKVIPVIGKGTREEVFQRVCNKLQLV